MPSTIERVSNYTPLNTSYFDGNLSANENNLQAAMDRLDDIPSFLPFGVYSAISPLNASSNPYVATIERPITLLKWAQSFYIDGLNDGTNYWTINLIRLTTPSLTEATFSTAAYSGATWQQVTVTSFAAPDLLASHFALLVQAIKTGNPGPLYLAGPALQIVA